MSKIIYLKQEVKLGEIITYQGLEIEVTQTLIDNNPDIFRIIDEREKTLDDYEEILVKSESSVTFSVKGTCLSTYSWIRDNEPKLYYTKLLQLIADDLHGGKRTHIYKDTSYHINNTYGVNVHCGYDEGCVYFKSNELAEKAKTILGDKVKYLFN